jgi:hypothetical protein
MTTTDATYTVTSINATTTVTTTCTAGGNC